MILGQTSVGIPFTVDLPSLIGSHLAVIANSGGGKSGALRKLLEGSHGQVQHIVLDIEDEFYSLRERFPYVIAGGDGGDVPATVDNAADLARTTLQHGFSLIVQMNDLGDDAPAFVAAFLAGLMSAPRELWRPALVAIDEAQRFVPSFGSGTAATAGVRDLLQRGRKRGFTAVVASLRISEIDPGVRGMCNNWLLGRVGQALDRKAMADQLGFSGREAMALRSIEPRHFWAFGPALAAEPTLIRIGDVETTPVRPGQAKVATPPAPEELGAILAGLAQAAPADGDLVHPNAQSDQELAPALDELRAELKEMGQRALDAEAKWPELEQKGYERGLAAGISIGVTRARAALDRLRVPDIMDEIPAQGGGGPAGDQGQTEGRQVMTSAAPRAIAPAPAARTATEKAGGGNASPAALAIAELLDRINPARVTWAQAAAMTGRKASGGNFNAARKWLRGSGRIVEDGELIRSAADTPAGLSRDKALDLWRMVLSNPAPKMIDAFVQHGSLTKEELGAAIGAQPRGGNFNNGLAQLRRNGLLYEYGSGTLRLAEPLPGEVS